jgi:hypothetical protein
MSPIAFRTLHNNTPSAERFRFSEEKVVPTSVVSNVPRRVRTAAMQSLAKSANSSPRYSFETACDVLATALKNVKK